jgi:hypothetical protein
MLLVLTLGAALASSSAASDDVAQVVPPLRFSPGPEYADSVRMFQGIPGIERAANGRLWATWYGGGTGEDKYNYIMLVTSGDDGKTWSPLKLVIDPDRDGPCRAFDPCLWHDPLGRLWLFWAERHEATRLWAIVTEDSGNENPKWSQPRPIALGIMMNKPTVLSSGEWLLPVANWKSDGSSGVVASNDKGATWQVLGAANVPKPEDRNCDEHMIVQRTDSSLWMLVRTKYGIGNSFSTDRGRTWSEVQPGAILHTVSRFFIRRLASGKLLLVKHGGINEKTGRSHLTAFLSADDGQTWQGGLLLDERKDVSYPDGVQSSDGTMHVIYDYSRYRDKDILMATFTEADVLAGKCVSSAARLQVLVNHASGVRPVEKLAKPLTGLGAELEVYTPFEVDTFQLDAKLYLDRTYKVKECPKQIQGQPFLRSSIKERDIRCTADGLLTMLTPVPDIPKACSLGKALEQRGFVRIAKPEMFQLFGSQPFDQVRIYQKHVKKGDRFRQGPWAVVIGFSKATAGVESPKKPASENSGELLYNGIRLPEVWPPRDINPRDTEPMRVPYLESPPRVIPIDVGRQLLVDDFLVEKTDLVRRFHLPTKYEGNPILKPETELELNRSKNAIACPKSGGLWWNPELQQFQLWYEAGWINTICYATSRDGLHWERPNLDVQPGTNRVLPADLRCDSWTVVLDYGAKDPREKYKMFMRRPGGQISGTSMVSADGIHWIDRVETGVTGDRSTMFYNPFRRKWVYSLRSGFRGRSRHYWECDDFLGGARWKADEPVVWAAVDKLDPPDPEVQRTPQLYNLDAVAYESLMLGMFEIHLGPENDVCEKQGLPKITELNFAYSRDGFHWYRPDRTAAIRAERRDVWDRGYVQSLGNVCCVRGDRLWFYYIGFQGDTAKKDNPFLSNGMYDRGATGVAFLRRDGFASFDAGDTTGTLTTRPVQFTGTHLFVNADTLKGELRAEILDESGRPIEPFTLANCRPVRADGTIEPLAWNGGDLSKLRNRPVRLRFALRNGSLYSFWVSRDATGRSDGYIAGGGPGFTGPTDTVGRTAIEAERKLGVKAP